MPNSSVRSKCPIREASCTTSCSAESGLRTRSPAGPLDTCTTFRSSCAVNSAVGTGPIMV
eukprot:scaffold21940_cov122-Isochrysis_galbana.AAC.3